MMGPCSFLQLNVFPPRLQPVITFVSSYPELECNVLMVLYVNNIAAICEKSGLYTVIVYLIFRVRE
jgi:hypothetical protein